MDIKFSLYAVRNHEGLWFRAKGYGGYGKSWVDDLSKARIYARVGPAKAQVSYCAQNYPDKPLPLIVELVVSNYRIIDDSNALKNRIVKRQIKAEKIAAKRRIEEIAYNESRLEEINKKIASLKEGSK